MGFYSYLRSRIESFFKQRSSKKELELIEKYYRKRFVGGFNRPTDNMHTFMPTDRNSKGRELADMKSAARGISDYAEENDISAQALAAFCFEEVFEDASEELKKADNFLTGSGWGELKMPSDKDLKEIRQGDMEFTGKAWKLYQISKVKFATCEYLIEEYNLAGGTESVDFFIKLVESRQKKLNILEDQIQDDLEKTQKALKDFKREIAEEQEDIAKRVKSVVEGSIEAWMRE